MRLRKFGEIALVAGTAGGTGAALTTMLRLGFDSGDVFAFSGALIGAAATVAGAAWLNDRAVQTNRQREVTLITEACADLLKVTIETFPRLPNGPDSAHPNFGGTMRHLFDVAEEVGAILREAIARAETLNFRQRVRVIRAEAAIDLFAKFFHFVFDHDEEDYFDERTWDEQLVRMQLTLNELLSELGRR